MKLGDIIHARRKELGLTLEQVGNITGVTKNTVRQWEIGGIANMRRDRIAKLAEALQIDPIDLIAEDDTADVENSYIRIWWEPLIEAYQQSPDYIQKAICQMLQIEQVTIPILPTTKKERKNRTNGNRKKGRSNVAGEAQCMGHQGTEGRCAESISKLDAGSEGEA